MCSELTHPPVNRYVKYLGEQRAVPQAILEEKKIGGKLQMTAQIVGTEIKTYLASLYMSSQLYQCSVAKHSITEDAGFPGLDER